MTFLPNTKNIQLCQRDDYQPTFCRLNICGDHENSGLSSVHNSANDPASASIGPTGCKSVSLQDPATDTLKMQDMKMRWSWERIKTVYATGCMGCLYRFLPFIPAVDTVPASVPRGQGQGLDNYWLRIQYWAVMDRLTVTVTDFDIFIYGAVMAAML